MLWRGHRVEVLDHLQEQKLAGSHLPSPKPSDPLALLGAREAVQLRYLLRKSPIPGRLSALVVFERKCRLAFARRLSASRKAGVFFCRKIRSSGRAPKEEILTFFTRLVKNTVQQCALTRPSSSVHTYQHCRSRPSVKGFFLHSAYTKLR